MALYQYDILCDKYRFFYATLNDKLHDLETSIGTYIEKSSGRIHVTFAIHMILFIFVNYILCIGVYKTRIEYLCNSLY